MNFKSNCGNKKVETLEASSISSTVNETVPMKSF